MPADAADFPIVVALPIRWGDQDAFGHVNNTVYVRCFESARIEYFAHIGLSEMMSQKRVGPILASVTCHFRRQLNFPDTVNIGARITGIGRTSLKMQHRIDSEATGQLVGDGESVLVVFDYEAQRPVPVPDSIREAIARLEGKPFDG